MSKKVSLALAAALVLTVAAPALAQTKPAPASADSSFSNKVLIEIYRIAPGQHEAFMRAIDAYDDVNRAAGLPPRQLYVHSDGADWDFMLIQPASTPDDKRAAMDAAYEKSGLPSGAKFFVEFRKHVAEHSDTFARGPTTAKAFLADLAK
ncbi:hypothetical protein [Phenylobacterium sp.]|uniref:hypothetical protein n=1 Tax=Phenylobacterium sp. TaxID=1871053 RepID=UPI002FCB3D80